jgi:prepilin-type N-terminal cleavage/methylation domain-containing protein
MKKMTRWKWRGPNADSERPGGVGRPIRHSPTDRREPVRRLEPGFGLIEVMIALVILVVGLVALLGALSSVLVMEGRLRKSSLETVRLWSETEQIRVGSSDSEALERLVISPEMRPLRVYVVGNDEGVKWRVWRDD